MTHAFSSRLKARARGTLLGRYSLPMLAYLLVDLITLLISASIAMLFPQNSRWAILSVLATLIVAIFSSLFQTGYQYLMLNMARGKAAGLSDLLYPIRTMPDHVILLSLRLMLLAFACMLPMIAGAILLILSSDLLGWGICLCTTLVSLTLAVMVAIDYSQIFFLYLDNPYLACSEIMRQSRAMMRGNRRRFLYLNVSFLGMGLLAVLSLGIGILWIGPYQAMTLAEFYRALSGEHETEESRNF